MSNFAQIVTSFERTGNFPLEANYIFSTEEALKQYYSDEILAATLHKGLLKIVENDGNGKQALYWVTKKATNDELEFTKLVAGDNISDIQAQLDTLLENLTQETADRKAADTALWGLNDPTNIDEGYNSINDLANQVKTLQTALAALGEEVLSGDNSLKNQIKGIVGTDENDVIAYMQTLPYKTITELAKALDHHLNGTSEDSGDSGDSGSTTDTTDTIDTLPELKAFLDGYTNKDTLKALLNTLWLTIEGETLPSESFRTLRGVEDYIIEYRTANDYKQNTLLEEMNNLEAGVGLNADGSYTADAETYYLQNATSVMNALKTLDVLLHKYISANAPSVRNNDEAIYLSLTQELDSYVLAAALKLSTQASNQIIKNSDGLYSCAKTYYENGVLTFKVNDNIVSQHYIGMNAIVQSARYDKDNEQLEFIFKLDSGDTQTVLVPVGALIREWEPYNADTSPVVLTRTENLSGTDTLSADLKVSTAQFNIVEIVDGAVYVKGTTNNIYHEGKLLSEYITETDSKYAEAISAINASLETIGKSIESTDANLAKEVTDRTAADAELQKQITSNGTAIKETQENLATETTNRKDADSKLAQSIETEKNRAVVEEQRLELAVQSEQTRAEQVESDHSTILQTLTEKISDEITRSTNKDIEIENKIANIHHPEYTVEKLSTPVEGCIASYIVTKDGVQAGNNIDIPEVPVEVNATYEKGILTLIVNGTTIGIFDLGLSAAVKDSYYDTTSDEIVTEYNLHNGSTQVVRTSVHYIMEQIDAKVAELNEKINNIKIPEYTVVKQATPDAGNFATYYVAKDNEQTGSKINIPEQIGASAENGNQILEKTDGLYMKVDTTYENGVLSLLVNDSVVRTFNLGVTSVVKEGYYDSTTEELVTIYNLSDGGTQTVRVPVHSLIQEWIPLNEGHTVAITRTQVVNGPDTVSADIVIAENVANNILKKDTTGVFVEGTASNIVADTGNTVQKEIDSINENIAKKADIDSPIFTGVPQSETSPDATDFSQRLATTAWVKARMDEVLAQAKEYADSLLAIEWIDVDEDESAEDTGTGWINVP